MYHNTTARYNAYFYAKKSIEEIEGILEESRDNDYDKVLKIYPELDSTLAATYNTQSEEVIKKASIAIERHKNSKWVDDSYILVGLARYYSMDFVNAIETFKYVNKHGESDDERHRALIDLMKTFTDYEEYNNAVATSDYLKKEKIGKKNEKNLHLVRAHFYEKVGDIDKKLENLVKAAPLLKKRDGKGRIYFMIGQIYQELGFDAEAYNYYKRCIASNPVYELDFYARLNMAQVAVIGKSKDARSTRKLFEKLLVDKKNKEFKDKIYYEMGKFELKQNKLEEAIGHFKSSLQQPSSNKRQKGQSYLKLGIIYYDSLREYELAKAYYDSTITALPTDYDNYDKIKARQEILADFVEQINTINTQDSLLALAALDSAEIRRRIDEVLEAEAERQRQEEAKSKRRQRQNALNLINEGTGISGAGWYFGNPSAVAIGQSEFKRIWGERPLEDNWRRSNKEVTGRIESSDPSIASEENNANNEVETLSEADQRNVQAEAMYSEIPFSKEEQALALSKIEEAYYKLGNIYNFNLEEEDNAANAFESLLSRFPETEYEAEALYQLYLIYKEQENEKYIKFKAQLLDKHPNTTYAKLIQNPNYTEESTQANEKLKKLYKEAYQAYENQNYDTALIIINRGFKEYPETVFTPRLKLLQILITGKTEDINLYQYQLSEFIENNPDTDITPYAKDLLEASKEFAERQRRIIGTSYIKYFKEQHYFVLIYENKNLPEELSPLVENYNSQNYPGQNLQTSNLILSDNYTMVMVSHFETKDEALDYFNRYRQSNPISENKLNSKFHKFVITKSNFNIFYESKDPEPYLIFFEKNYTNGS